MIHGVGMVELKKNADERGFFAELIREDWKSFLEGDHIVQFSLSQSQPDVIRAWHRHTRGQNDYLVCISGTIRCCVYDDRKGSKTRGELDEFVLSSMDALWLVRIAGDCWHGYKVISQEPALVLYGVTKLYDHAKPDEERLAWDDGSVIPTSINGRADDSRAGSSYDWGGPAGLG